MKNIAIYRDICLARELQMSYLIAIFAKVVEIKDKDICQKYRDNIAYSLGQANQDCALACAPALRR